MPNSRICRQIGAIAGMLLVLGSVAPAAAAEVSTESRRPFPQRSSTVHRGVDGAASSGSWWLGTAGIALALALCGGISVASKRYLPGRTGGGALRVVGRASLSPKQAVYLVAIGERILIVGAGAQGPPSLLGELTDPAERAQFGAAARPAGASVPIGPGARTVRFDARLGDDE